MYEDFNQGSSSARDGAAKPEFNGPPVFNGPVNDPPQTIGPYTGPPIPSSENATENQYLNSIGDNIRKSMPQADPGAVGHDAWRLANSPEGAAFSAFIPGGDLLDGARGLDFLAKEAPNLAREAPNLAGDVTHGAEDAFNWTKDLFGGGKSEGAAGAIKKIPGLGERVAASMGEGSGSSVGSDLLLPQYREGSIFTKPTGLSRVGEGSPHTLEPWKPATAPDVSPAEAPGGPPAESPASPAPDLQPAPGRRSLGLGDLLTAGLGLGRSLGRSPGELPGEGTDPFLRPNPEPGTEPGSEPETPRRSEEGEPDPTRKPRRSFPTPGLMNPNIQESQFRVL